MSEGGEGRGTSGWLRGERKVKGKGGRLRGEARGV